MNSVPRWRWVSGLALLAAVVLLVRWCPGSGEPDPSTVPMETATAALNETPPPTARATRLVPLSEIDVPAGCELFESGELAFGSGTQFAVGVRVHMELQATPCGMQALLNIVADSDRLSIDWASAATADSPTSASLFYDSVRDRWVGATRFNAAGIWTAPAKAGFISSIIVEWDSYQLESTTATNALQGEPQHIWVQDADGALTRYWALTSGTALGWLRDPERVAFIQIRGDTSVLVLGQIDRALAETAFEVGRFPTVSAAPDGRAVAVSWINDQGFAEARMVAAAGWYTTLDLGDARSATFWWAPTSDLLLVVTESELLALSPGGGVRARHELDTVMSRFIEWSPDGSYALLVDRTTSAGTRIDRFDTTTLELERLLDRGLVMVGPDSISISASGTLALAWWDSPSAAAIRLAVVESDELVGLVLEDHEVQRFGVMAGLESAIGGFAWSPAGNRLAFTSVGLDLPDGAADATSSLAVLDIGPGEVIELVGSEALFTTFAGSVAWSSDGNTILVQRMECADCEDEGLSYEVVDATSGLMIGTIARPASFEGWASDLAALEILGSEAAYEEMSAEFQQLAEALLLWSMVRSPGGSSYALVMPPKPGAHVYLTEGERDELRLLTTLELGSEIASMLGDQYLVVRDGTRWVRTFLSNGSSAPYAATNASHEGAAFVASPSGELALALDDDGFVLLDATAPEADPLQAHRAWPPDLGDRRDGISWSSDESQIVVAGTEVIAVIDVRSGATAVYQVESMGVGLDPTDDAQQPLTASWGVNRRSVVFATREALWQLDGQSGEARLIAEAPLPGGFTSGTVLSPAPDGSAMAVGTAFGVFLPEPDGEWRLISRVGVPASGGPLHWSRDSSAIAYAGVTASGQAFGVIEVAVDSSEARLVVSSEASDQVLGWLDHGRIVFVFRTSSD